MFAPKKSRSISSLLKSLLSPSETDEELPHKMANNNNQQAIQANNNQMAPIIAPRNNEMAAYVRSQLLVNTSLSQQQRDRELGAVVIQETLAANNVQLPAAAGSNLLDPS
jgi:predicted 2-oxoglutarate/Fe(II)-dependent dioxygenase YbiX